MTHYFKHKARGKKFGTIVGWVLLAIVVGTGMALLFGYGLMWLWNWLMPGLFDLPLLNYWQAVGIFVLAKILFGGSGHHGHRGNKRSRNSHKYCKGGEGKHFGGDFSKWKHYDEFWKEEGGKAYDAYLEKMAHKSEDPKN